MAVYDLEEQDQLEDLKAWWTHWGNYITAGALAVCVGIVGVQGWRWWQRSQAEQASALYTTVSDAVKGKDVSRAKEALTQLVGKYPGTAYTPRAALIAARLKFDDGDKAGAKTDLQWVIDRSNEDELKEIARYRLAEIQFDDKQYDEALRSLDAKHSEAFDGLYADLKGDILAAAGRREDARAAYQAAFSKLDPKSAYRNYVEVKLNSLGGPVTPPASAASGAVTPPAGVAPTAPATGTPPAPSQSAGGSLTITPAGGGAPIVVTPTPGTTTVITPSGTTTTTAVQISPKAPAASAPATPAPPAPASPAPAAPAPSK